MFSFSLLQPKSFTMPISIPTLKPSTLIAKPKCKPYTTQQQTYPTQKPYPHTLKPHVNPIKSQKDFDGEEFCKIMKPTTVAVTSFFGDSLYPSEGSGTLINEDGYILSCARLFRYDDMQLQHIIHEIKNKKLEYISVRLSNGKLYRASLVAIDSEKDLALIKIVQELGENFEFPFASFPLEDPGKPAGSDVFSISNMHKQPFSFTHGKVSCPSRLVIGGGTAPSSIGGTTQLIQATLLMGTGSFGAPLFDHTGLVYGILSFSIQEGVSFAIHLNEVHLFLNKCMMSHM